jgi:putative membrane protein insertion efficiency factor
MVRQGIGFLLKGLRFLPIALVCVYRYGLSWLLPKTCRFEPTCSEYTIQALRRHGVWRGGKISLRRIVRCHPWGGSGFDPVP